MPTITHTPNCPSLPSGGASGPCLCLPVRGEVTPFVPRQTPWSPYRSGSPRLVERNRAAAVKAASAALRGVGRRWKDAREWAIDAGRDGARALHVSSLDPTTVTAYLAALGAPTAD